MIPDASPATLPADDERALRRTPSQKRSRERVEHILSCATAIIQEKGSDAMRMSEVAEKAGISIGSLYQYFPDKAAIVRTLAERYNAVCNECIAAELAKVTSIAELRDAFSLLFDIYYAMFLAEPVMRDIWSGTQADKALQEIDLTDSRVTGKLLAAAMERVRPDAGRDRIATRALLIMNLGVATMRLAIAVGPKEGAALVEAYKEMALRELSAD